MKKHSALMKAISLLILLSAAIYAAQILLFRDMKDTAFYLMQDFAFLPVQVALVSVIAGKILQAREREKQIEKTRMLTGSFFSSAGADLLCAMVPAVEDPQALSRLIEIDESRGRKEFDRAAARIRSSQAAVHCGPETLARMKEILEKAGMPLLVISSNPMLLEHECFTDMLWAVFHLADEFRARGDLSHLTPQDAAHLDADVQRVLTAILANWVLHAAYLKTEYPYLFRLELMRNLFWKEEKAR